MNYNAIIIKIFNKNLKYQTRGRNYKQCVEEKPAITIDKKH